ncbi:MAG TPA: nodulation protein NfeD, partial [Thermoplasmataceae archaeon]|nr:nodulation protein NfeD [Thermoplasmataceae archaeon]
MNVKIILLLLFILVGLSLTAQSAASSQPQKVVVVLNLHEEIDPGSASFFGSALSSLSSTSTEAVVIDMNTPGGILENMLQMVQYINI